MCAILREYGVVPIFVFDGGRIDAKSRTLQERKEARIVAKEELKCLESQLGSMEGEKKVDMIHKINMLQRQVIAIKNRHVTLVKSLLDSMGIIHVTAPREADELCASLAIKGDVYACLSEDTDIIAYGCRRVLRYFSLIKHTVVLYDIHTILDNLGMSRPEFKDLCLVSGNDYIKTRRNIFYYYKLFEQYRQSSCKRFLDWLLNKRYLSLQEFHALLKVGDLYTLKDTSPLPGFAQLETSKNKVVDESKLRDILVKHGNFVFP